ncbi:MAG: ABC-2 transporter permease, partial [Spirochaetales bacterium]|nr:ABC-2 transporter permease [Spirochaetales bacterium]
MKRLLKKEFKLTSLKLTYYFILFSLMSFIPGYPILLGAFFLTLGIFQSFENARLQNDTLFSLLLPVTKKDIVVSKYCYVMIVEAIFF